MNPPPQPVCLCNSSPYLPSRSTQPARSQAARGKGDHSRVPRGDAGLHNTLHRSFWLEWHTSCSAGGDGAFEIPSSPRFSGTPADGWRARRMQWMLTARLLWRVSSNLRTHRRGCCSRPPNGFQSGWGMKSHNEELWDPLCCRQCWRLYQNKMQLSARKQVYHRLILVFFCFYQTAIYILLMLYLEYHFPLYEKSVLHKSYQKYFFHTVLLHWCSLSWDINALTSMILCEKTRCIKKKVQHKQVQ